MQKEIDLLVENYIDYVIGSRDLAKTNLSNDIDEVVKNYEPTSLSDWRELAVRMLTGGILDPFHYPMYPSSQTLFFVLLSPYHAGSIVLDINTNSALRKTPSIESGRLQWHGFTMWIQEQVTDFCSILFYMTGYMSKHKHKSLMLGRKSANYFSEFKQEMFNSILVLNPTYQ